MLVLNETDLDSALDTLRKSESPLLIDTETSGLRMFARENPARMCGIAIGPLGDPTGAQDFYLPFRHGEGYNLPLSRLAEVRDLVASRTWVGHNLAFDTKILAMDGFPLPSRIIDTIIAAHLVDENEDSFALKSLGAKYLGAEAATAEAELKAHLKERKLGKGDMCQLPATLVAPYALQDIMLTRKLLALYEPELKRWRLEELFTEVNEFSLALVRMEMRGLMLDVDEVNRQIVQIGPRMAETERLLKELAGRGDININSPAQLCEWLKMKSTSRDAIKAELERNPRAELRALLEYRELKKAESTYFRPFLELRDLDNRLHTNFKVHGTVTGRLSSSEPNLQNASRDQTGRAYSVRNCFTASPGCFLVEADFSAVEPRIAAHYSEDPTMMEAFSKGQDFHTAVARAMFKKDGISKEERTSAKTVGLGTLYGMGAHKAARSLKLRHDKLPDGTWAPHSVDVWAFHDGELCKIRCDVADPEFCTHAGRAFIGKFYDGVPELKPFLQRIVRHAKVRKYVRNPVSQRVRRFNDRWARHFSAPNSLIQSTAADILRRALTRLDKEFVHEDDPQMVLTVHDSIVFEVRHGPRALEQIKRIKHVMETTAVLKVPLIVDIKIGNSLGNMGDLVLDNVS